MAPQSNETRDHVVESSDEGGKSNDRLGRLESDKGDQDSEEADQKANQGRAEEEGDEPDLSGRCKVSDDTALSGSTPNR